MHASDYNYDFLIIVDYLASVLPVNVGIDIRTEPRKILISFIILIYFSGDFELI